MQAHGIEVRDVILPGELRKAFSEVPKANSKPAVFRSGCPRRTPEPAAAFAPWFLSRSQAKLTAA